MPEAPEVKKYSQFLLQHMKNQKIKKITIINGRYKKHGPFQGYDLLQKSLPLKVIDIQTKGKFMYFVFENELHEHGVKRNAK
jgi:formamidopyrimidine-DNA glycosylase